MAEKDWSARFKLSERKPVPYVLLLVIACIVPFGPWYFDVPLTLLLAVILYLKLRQPSNRTPE